MNYVKFWGDKDIKSWFWSSRSFQLSKEKQTCKHMDSNSPSPSPVVKSVGGEQDSTAVECEIIENRHSPLPPTPFPAQSSWKPCNLCPDWSGSGGWVLSCKPKGHKFNSHSGHIPGLQVQFLGQSVEWEVMNTSMFLSLSFSLPSPSLKFNFFKAL